jgi:ACS family hexuronate transporter-like MFS transporter
LKTIKGLRWWIIALVCLGTIINYLARNSLGVLAPQLKTELGMSTQQYSYVVAAFQVGYTIMQPVCGFIVDLIGLRIGFALFAVLWSFAGVLHAGASGWLSLAGFRGLMGLTEAAAIPSGMKAVAEWFPDKEKSVAVGWFNAGTSLGAMLAPPLVIFLHLRYGWQSAFVVTGAIGFVWAALWFAFYRSPRDHASLSDAEREQIVGGQLRPVGAVRGKRPVKEVVTSRRFWAIALARFFAEPAWQTFSFWIPLYFVSERHLDLKTIAMFAWLPFLAADLGGLAGGYLSPLLMKRFRMVARVRRCAGRRHDDWSGVRGARRVSLYGHRAVLRGRLCAPDDFHARQHTGRRRVRSGGGGYCQWLCRHVGVDWRPGLLAAGGRAGRQGRLRPTVRHARRV